MVESDIREVLQELATGTASRSETARLRDIYAEVERAAMAGVTHEAILKALHAAGFTLTLKSFQSALYRLRAKAKDKAGGRKEERRGEVFMGQEREALAVSALVPRPGKLVRVSPKANPLGMPARPKSFEWDPVERPVIEFDNSGNNETAGAPAPSKE